MTNEERKQLYCDFHAGVRMMMDKIEKIAREKKFLDISRNG